MELQLDITTIIEQVKKAIEKPRQVWDDFVPIVPSKCGTYTDVYLTNEIAAPEEYNELCHVLKEATEDMTFYFHINSPGGYIVSTNMLYYAMKRSKAHIIGDLSGEVSSAVTVLTMACDEIHINPYTQFMIHNYSGGVSGKGKEAKDHMDFVNNEINLAFREYYAGFLTEDEITEVIDDHDIWLNSTQVLERWARKKSLET